MKPQKCVIIEINLLLKDPTGITQHILQVRPHISSHHAPSQTDRWQQRAMRPQQPMPQGPLQHN